MRLTEWRAKELLAQWGIAVPRSILVASPAEAAGAAVALGGGPLAVKAQVRSGGRGKAGGVVLVSDPTGAEQEAARLLGAELLGETVTSVLIEEAVEIEAERYLSVTIDGTRRCPVLMRSRFGGVDIEEAAATGSDAVEVVPLDPSDPSSPPLDDPVEKAVVELYQRCDAVTVEINPLAIIADGSVVALDGKIELDDSARYRQTELHRRFADEGSQWGSERERRAVEHGLRLIELGGDVAILANGAGLTMATMDAVAAAGGRPANFCEIGGDAYTKAVPALELVLAQPGVRSLVVNFCGAFARCDVMTEGVIAAWKHLQPAIPVAFSVAGTGRDEAVALLKNELGVEPHPSMERAVRAAVAAAAAQPS